MSISKRKLLMNSFFTSQFNYCPLTWMCHSRTMNNKINCLHERCFHIVDSGKTSSFEKLLEKDAHVKTAHVGYVKLIYLMLVLFKVLSWYLFLKHIQEQSTNNSLMKGLFYGRTS